MGGYLTNGFYCKHGQGRNMLGMLDPNNTTGWMEQGLTLSPSRIFKRCRFKGSINGEQMQ